MFRKDRTAANTGPTSGIGLACARALAAEGADLAIDGILPPAEAMDAATASTGATLPIDGGWAAE